jgi:hypothetical protein
MQEHSASISGSIPVASRAAASERSILPRRHARRPRRPPRPHNQQVAQGVGQGAQRARPTHKTSRLGAVTKPSGR